MLVKPGIHRLTLPFQVDLGSGNSNPIAQTVDGEEGFEMPWRVLPGSFSPGQFHANRQFAINNFTSTARVRAADDALYYPPDRWLIYKNSLADGWGVFCSGAANVYRKLANEVITGCDVSMLGYWIATRDASSTTAKLYVINPLAFTSALAGYAVYTASDINITNVRAPFEENGRLWGWAWHIGAQANVVMSLPMVNDEATPPGWTIITSGVPGTIVVDPTPDFGV